MFFEFIKFDILGKYQLYIPVYSLSKLLFVTWCCYDFLFCWWKYRQFSKLFSERTTFVSPIRICNFLTSGTQNQTVDPPKVSGSPARVHERLAVTPSRPVVRQFRSPSRQHWRSCQGEATLGLDTSAAGCTVRVPAYSMYRTLCTALAGPGATHRLPTSSLLYHTFRCTYLLSVPHGFSHISD